MKKYELRGVELPSPAPDAFRYIADPGNLPAWTNAFASVDGDRAMMRTPEGEIEIGLRVDALPELGTVDWHMTFPDEVVATAYSRVVPLDERTSAYSFVLTPPPAPLEAIEGILADQVQILERELDELVQILAER